jgi:hypothetical protein
MALADAIGQEATIVPMDRSDDLALRWIVDASPEPPGRDEPVFLEIENKSGRPISLSSDVASWLELVARAPGRDPLLLNPSRSEGARAQEPIVVPAGLTLHLRLPVPAVGTSDSTVGDLSLIAFLEVLPTDVVARHCPGPKGSPIPDPVPPVEFAGYRARVTSPALLVRWERREYIVEERPPDCFAWYQQLRLFGDLQDETRRRDAARQMRLPENTSAKILSGLDEAAREWSRSLGSGSTATEADDQAFAIAAHAGFNRTPNERRRWLRWVIEAHPDTTGARRADALLEWVDAPAGPQAYLALGG